MEEQNTPQQQVSQQSSMTPAPVPRSNVLMVVLVGLLMLVFGLGGGYFLFANKSPQVSHAPTQQARQVSPTSIQEVPTVVPRSTDTVTANWKTYTSSFLSFKYPTTFTLEERQKDFIVLLSDANNPQSVFISIDTRRSGSYVNYTNAVSSTKAGLTNVQTEEMPNGVKLTGKVGPGYAEGQPITIALFKSGTSAVEAETSTTNQNQLQIFNQIISTFTLTK